MAIKPNRKVIAIAAVVIVIFILGSLLSYWIYISKAEEQRTPSSNQGTPLSLSHQEASRRAQEALKKNVEEDLNKKYNSVDGLIEAFTKYENSKEVDVNSLEGSKRTTMQAIGGMSNGTLKKLKTVAEGEKVTMSQNDCDSLKNFINGAQIDEPLRQTLIENLENNVAIISETSPIDTSTPEAIEKLITVEFGRDFLDAINTLGYQVDINAHLVKLDKFSNVPLDDISKLYAKDADITNAKKQHLNAKELVNVIKHCKDRGPKTLPHNDPMLDKLNKVEVKAYLKDDDYRKFLATFKTTASDGPDGVEGLKNFKSSDGCLPYSPNLLVNLKLACVDDAAKTNNPLLATLCGLQSELQTLHVLIEGNITQTVDFEQLEHLLRLKQNNSLICPNQVDELLDESKKNVITDYLNVAKIEEVNNPPAIDVVRLRDAGKKLLLLLPHLQTTAKLTVEKRIIDLRDNDQLDTADKLITKDLSNLIQALYNKLKDPLAETSKLDAQITVFFEAIQAIDSSIGAITKTQYLKNLDATWKFEEAMKVVIAELKNKIIDLNWKFATDVDPFKDKIEELISAFDEAKAVVPTYTCNEIKKPWKETFKALVKSNIVPELIERLKSEPLAITTKADEWATLVKEIHKIDQVDAGHPGLFEEVKSLTKVTDGASLISWITLKKSANYEAIIKRNFSTQPLDLSPNIDLIRYLRTIGGNPLLIDMLKSDAVADPSLTILTEVINVIDKIEAASTAIADSSSSPTLNLAQRQAVVAIYDRTDLIAPFTMKPLKDDIEPIAADFIAGLNALLAGNTNSVNVDKCRQAADKLILFKTIDDISDIPSLPSSVAEKTVELLLMGSYDTGSKFIQSFFENYLAKSLFSVPAEAAYNVYGLFKDDNGPFDWDKLSVIKYTKEKNAHLDPIRESLLSIDADKISMNLLDSHVPGLANIRNNLFYSFDPVEPAFERNEVSDDMKAKILAHYHSQVMGILIGKWGLYSGELFDDTKVATKSALQFMTKYFNLSPKFKNSLPSDIRGITNGNILKAFFDVRLHAANDQFEACVIAVAKSELRPIIINDPLVITEKGVPAINNCIERRLQYGPIPNHPGLQEKAIKYDEKMALVKNAAELLVKEEVKTISESLAIQLVNTENYELLLKSDYEVLKRIEEFADTSLFPTLKDFYKSCYDYTWKIIGHEVITTKTTQTEIMASRIKMANFKKLPDLQSINELLLLKAEMVSEILPNFQMAAHDNRVAANVRSKDTLSKALMEPGANVGQVKDFWKYKLAIWYLVNKSHDDVAKLLEAAKKVVQSSDVSNFEGQLMAMRDTTTTPPEWIINSNKISRNGVAITNAPLFEFLNALVDTYLLNMDHGPFFKRDEQAFIKELVTNGTIDVVKDAILLTDCQWELNSLANKGSITKATWDNFSQFHAIANDCCEKGHVEELRRFLVKQSLYVRDPDDKTAYKTRIIELTLMEVEQKLKSKLDEIDNSLKDEMEFKNLMIAFISPNLCSPHVIRAIGLNKYENSAAAAVADKKKAFWDLFRQFMNASIKYHALCITDVPTLAHHQEVLIELKRIELFNAIQPTGGGSKNLILTENYDKVKDQIILSSTTPAEEARYLAFLKLLADLKDKSFFNSSPTVIKQHCKTFFDQFSINHFNRIIEANELSENEIVGLKTWLVMRRELFGVKDGVVGFIDSEVQSSVNEVLELYADYGEAKLDTINVVPISGPMADARDLFSRETLDKFIEFWNNGNGEPWMDAFVDKLLATGIELQKYHNALRQLIINIDNIDIEPDLGIKFASLKPELNGFFAMTRRAYVWHKLKKLEESLAPLPTGASVEDRIRHCYLSGIPQEARYILKREHDKKLNSMIEKAKLIKNGDPLRHESQRSHANDYLQLYRLWDLFNALEDPIIIVPFGLGFEVEIPSPGDAEAMAIKEEIMNMPFLVNSPQLKSELAAVIDKFNSFHDNIKAIKKVIKSYYILIQANCRELLDEEAMKLIWDQWKGIASSTNTLGP